MNPFIYIAGPCVIESEDLTLSIAGRLKSICDRLPVRFVFKASYDKANRTSLSSFRGPGIDEGLRILAAVKKQLEIEVMSDVHDMHDMERAAEVLDVIQIPAFLCRQTDLLVAAAKTGRVINVKKGQFVAPQDMRYTVGKIEQSGNNSIWLTERGTTFGYNNLVVDFRSFDIMREFGHPIIFDATHAVQIPSAGGASSGRREFVAPLARAAAAYGIDGLFTEVYPEPDAARCDGPNSIRLDSVEGLLSSLIRIREAAQ
ncbi:MAG: 3-deoxy-8-phosphooctulonate synthase [Candidatus Sumerlaeia bacterium]